MFSKIKNFLKTTLIGGVVVILPATIFIVIINMLVKFTINLISPVARLINMGAELNETLVYLLAFVLVIVFCFIMGLFVRTRLGKTIWHSIENEWLSRLPMYSIIKETVQQFTGAKKLPFSKVVQVDVFNTGVLQTGFITEEHPTGAYTVFVPTAPNPTNGFVFHLPPERVTLLEDVPSDVAIRSIISIGSGSNKVVKI